jgi:predicted TPR repeat methyltransferase
LDTFCSIPYVKYSLGETNPDWRWQLTASGRFAHRKEYIAAVGEAHDLTVVHYETLDGFRHEHGTDVRGHLFVMTTTTNAPLDTKNDEF